MTRIAYLVLAACALTAVSSASIAQTDIAPETLIHDEQKPIEIIKEDSAPSPAEDIPVKVVVEDNRPLDDLNEVSDDEERPHPDLKNPGEPQRQEHETQNPEYFLEEAAKLFSLKENIDQAQALLRQGFQGVSDDIQNWISNNEQLNNIQQNIRNLRQTFSSQIQKLNESLQGFVKPDSSAEESQVKRDFRNIESRIQSLQENFNSGLTTLTEGVRIIASLRSQEAELRQASPAEGEPAAPVQPAQPAQPAAPAPANPPQNILVQYADMVSTSVSQGFNNVTQAIGQYFTNNNPITGLQNFLNPTTSTGAPGALADTPEGSTTQRPNSPWQNWQGYFTNIFSGGQGVQAGQTAGQAQPASPQGPLSGFQNLPFIQNVVQLIQNRPGASTTAKPAEAPAAAAGAPSGSNVVPEQPAPEAQNDKPAEPTATLPPPPVGPIRQILNSIPVVQRIQNTLANSGNPEKPRDPVVKSASGQIKAGFFPPPPPRPNHSGDNNDSSDGIKEKPEPIKEESPKDEPKKESEEAKPEQPIKSVEAIKPEEPVKAEAIKPEEKPAEIAKTE